MQVLCWAASWAWLLLPSPRDSFPPRCLQPAVGWDDALSSGPPGRFSALWTSLGSQGAFQTPEKSQKIPLSPLKPGQTPNLLKASPPGEIAAPATTVLASGFLFRCWTGSDPSFLEDTDLFHIEHWAGASCSRAGIGTWCLWL